MDMIPTANHYKEGYLGRDFIRFASYFQQLAYTDIVGGAQSTLVVGVGDGIVIDALRSSGIKTTTLDIQDDLHPDLVASVGSIPAEDRSFDVAICCQVLEHLPFDQVSGAFAELGRVTARRLIISVPDVRPCMSVRFAFRGRRVEWQASPPKLNRRVIPKSRYDKMGHFWEVGYKDTPIEAVLRAMTAPGWQLTIKHRVHDLPWHLFLVFDRN